MTPPDSRTPQGGDESVRLLRDAARRARANADTIRQAMGEANRVLRSWNLPEIQSADDACQACVASGRNPDAMTFGELVDWLTELRRERLIRGLTDESDDPWIPVRADDVRQNRATLARHAEANDKPFVRKVGRGCYEIRRSELGRYLRPSLRKKFGLDSV